MMDWFFFSVTTFTPAVFFVCFAAVSYTHLDVYKRQFLHRAVVHTRANVGKDTVDGKVRIAPDGRGEVGVILSLIHI